MIQLKTLLAALMLILLPQTIGAAEANDSVRVLWIGNSYTFYNDLPRMVQEIGATQNVKYAMTTVTKGGERLSGHLQNPRLIELLAQGGWDYVIVQEFSSTPAYSTTTVVNETYPYAHTIDSLAMAGSPGAKVIFYMTWGHKYGNTRQTPYPLDDTYTAMQDRLKLSYLEMAYDNDAWCAPVGMAWQTVRREHPHWELYKADNFHPSIIGSYLAANVIFTTMFRKPYTTYVVYTIPPRVAHSLQETAQQTVMKNLKLLNIK